MQTMNDNVNRITTLVNIMRRQADVVAKLETDLAAAKIELRRTEQVDLPELMTELGLAALELEDGSTLRIAREYQASVSQERMPRAVEWLEANGHGGLVKTQLIVSLAADKLQDLEYLVGEEGPLHDVAAAPPEVKQTINANTLKAFVKEQVEHGTPPPEDIFAFSVFSQAKLKAGKR
jgi:hypothetical protein